MSLLDSSSSPSSDRRLTGGRLLRIALLGVLVVVIGLGWLGYRRGVEFEGVVTEKDRRTRLTEMFSPTTRESRRYRHYLVLQNEAGEERRLRVRWQTYAQAEVGDPVAKRSGEMWPRLMTEEAVDRREGSREGARMIWDAMTSGDGGAGATEP